MQIVIRPKRTIMENKNEYPKNEELKKNSQSDSEAEFENPSVDPGFETTDEPAEGDNKENDALNYKNDREHGAFNPKNI
jgi:hypothetical protein